MPNHVHLILVPDREEALARALAETHRRYSSVINARRRVTGHLFQSRFSSVVMDEGHLVAAARPHPAGFAGHLLPEGEGSYGDTLLNPHSVTCLQTT